MAKQWPQISGPTKIKDDYPKLRTMAQYGTELEQRVDEVDERVDTILTGQDLDPNKDSELVDIRTPDGDYTPLSEIETAGGMTRDMQKQFVAHQAETVKLYQPEAYGAVGDGIEDDTIAITLAADAAEEAGGILYARPESTYLITSPIDLRHIPVIDFYGKIIVDFDDEEYAVLIGGDSNSATSYNIHFRSIRNATGSDPVNPFVRIVGLKNSNVKIDRCEYVQLYADTDDPTTTSIGYCSFYFNYVTKVQLTTNMTPAGSTSQWINQNKVFCDRTKEIIMDGTYGHNNNVFYSPDLSNGIVTFNVGNNNVIYDARFESGGTVTFGENTWANVIFQSFASTARNAFEQVGVTVSDAGRGNVLLRTQNLTRDCKPLVRMSRKVLNFNGVADNGVTSVTPGLDKLSVPNSTTVFTSDLIPVIPGVGFYFRSDQQIWRPRIEVYDANKDLLAGDDEGYMTIHGATWNTDGYYGYGSNRIMINSGIVNVDTVKYIRVIVASGSGAVNTPFEYFDFSFFVKKDLDSQLIIALEQPKSPLVRSASPTQGFARLGQLVSKSAGGVWTCTRSHETTLTSTVSTSGTSVTVDAIGDVANGDIVGILLDNGATHWTTVSSLSSATFTVGALPSQASAGARIVFNLWA